MNITTLQRTIFQNFGTERKTFGYRFYDSYNSRYCNTLSKEDLELDDLSFLAKLEENFTNEEEDMYEWAKKDGLMIDGQEYFYDQVGEEWHLRE